MVSWLKSSRATLAIIVMAGVAPGFAGAPDEAPTLPGGAFKTVVPFEEGKDSVLISPFRMDPTVVTNGEFLGFVKAHPDWQRSRAPRLFAGEGYLGHWKDDLELGKDVLADQPVTRVSWFAATEYCDVRGGRLPRWHEWEFAAAADEERFDARSDPAWRQRILAWYAVPSNRPLPEVPAGTVGSRRNTALGQLRRWLAEEEVPRARSRA